MFSTLEQNKVREILQFATLGPPTGGPDSANRWDKSATIFSGSIRGPRSLSATVRRAKGGTEASPTSARPLANIYQDRLDGPVECYTRARRKEPECEILLQKLC